MVEKSNSAEVVTAFRDRCAGDNLYRGLAEEKLALILPVKPPPSVTAECETILASVAGKETCLKPGDVFRDCAECPEMVAIPAGGFMMGSPESSGYDDERPQHKVKIAEPFAVSKFEISFAQWDACDPCATANDKGWGRGTRLAINVSWDDAKQYVGWLSGQTGKSYRLLSEAEWEYAARANSQTAYSFGDDATRLSEYAWYSENSGSKTHPVGEKQANQFGLHDMHGNVWEWVAD